MKKNRNYRRIFFSLALIIGLGLAVFPLIKNNFLVKVVVAGVNDSVSGWLWGGSEEIGDSLINGNETGVGWISMNSADCDIDGDRINDSCDMNGDGDVADDSNISISDYGVNIPQSSCEGVECNLTGYAWSSNLGWISFNETDLVGCPSGICSARRNGNKIEGWARIVGVKDALAVSNSGGWDGWISLNDVSGSSYGVTIKNDASGSLSGYGWNGEAANTCINQPCGLGWIDFSQAHLPMPPTVSLQVSEIDPERFVDTLNIELTKDDLLPPEQIKIKWTVENADDCTPSLEGVPSGSTYSGWTDKPSEDFINSGEMTIDLLVNFLPVSFELTCTNGGGEDSDTATVRTGCYPKSCDGMKCEASTYFQPVSNYNECDNKCSNDGDCIGRTNWIEN